MAVEGKRRVHRKVKTGCTACKVRRQKCDEDKPKCSSCIRFSTECLYDPSRRQQPPEAQYLTHAPSNDGPTQPRISVSLPPLPPSRDLNLEDLELLHQYMTSTSIATSQHAEATAQMQTAVPQLAQTHHFVMRGILAKAAIHLSWLRPSQKERYTLLAAKHHDAALPEFRSALGEMNASNYRALILYSKGLVWCAFAGYETSSPPQQEGEWLPQWFHLLRGSCLVVESCKQWIEGGSYLSPPPLDDLSEFEESLDHQRLAVLKSQLNPLVESSICEIVLEALQEAFARASMRHHNTPLRNAMNYWVGVIPDEYIEAVQMQEPWALVVMAHVCVLVSRSETRWFMRGHAAKLLHAILERLPPAWRQYVQWPCKEVGF